MQYTEQNSMPAIVPDITQIKNRRFTELENELKNQEVGMFPAILNTLCSIPSQEYHKKCFC